MAAPQGKGGIAVEVDSTEWYRLVRDLKKLDDGKALVTALRKRLRNAGTWAVDRIRKNLDMPSPDGGPDAGDMRALLAAATKVTISFSAKQAGAKVSTTEARIPQEHRGILRVYNKANFRHPVFGDTDTWVTQRGRPFFAEAFEAELVNLTRQEINAAMAEAFAVLDRR